jgi:chloramphenicol 3-O phosphotransferase
MGGGGVASGTVIWLNGNSSAGKTCVARALQEIMEEPYLHSGVDHFLERMPRKLFVHAEGPEPSEAEGWLMRFRDGELAGPPKAGPAGIRIKAAMYGAVAALARAGQPVIVDDLVYEADVMRAAVEAFSELDVLFVGVRCPLEVAIRRERERGARVPGGARTFHDLVHTHGVYDLEIDTAAHTPEESATVIKAALLENWPRTAVRRLRTILRS